MATGGPDNRDEFYFDPSGASHYETASDRHEERSPTGSEEDVNLPQPGTPDYLLKSYPIFYRERDAEITNLLETSQSDADLRQWLIANLKNVTDYRFCKLALMYLCQNYASEEQERQLIESNWDFPHMLTNIEILLMNCQRLPEVCHHLQQNELAMSSPHVSQVRITPKSTPKAAHNWFAGFKRFGIRPPFWKKHPGQRLDDGSLPRPHTIFSSPTIRDQFEAPFCSTPFSSTPFSRTIALSSPKREEPVLVNIGVDPKPLIDTESGERFVCDISIDVQPGGSDLQAQLAHVSGLSSPYTTPVMGVSELRRRGQIYEALPWDRHYHGGQAQLAHVSGLSSPYTFDTSADISRVRTPVMGVSQLRRRGQIRHGTPTSTGGLFTPTIHRSPRRSGTPGSPYNPSTVNEENFLDQSAAGRTMGSEGGFLEGSLHDSSIVNEGRFLDWP